jgi:hypothetical protein
MRVEKQRRMSSRGSTLKSTMVKMGSLKSVYGLHLDLHAFHLILYVHFCLVNFTSCNQSLVMLHMYFKGGGFQPFHNEN